MGFSPAVGPHYLNKEFFELPLMITSDLSQIRIII